MKLHVEWHRLRDNVLDVAKSRADSRDLRDLLSSITNDCDEGLTFCFVQVLFLFFDCSVHGLNVEACTSFKKFFLLCAMFH